MMNWKKSLPLILTIVGTITACVFMAPLFHVAIPFVATVIGIFFLKRSNSQWNPDGQTSRTKPIRMLESALIVCIIAPIALLALYEGTTMQHVPNLFAAETSPEIKAIYWNGWTIAAVVLLTAVLLSGFLRTSLGVIVLCFGMGAASLGTNSAISQRWMAQHRPAKDRYDEYIAAEMKIRFALPEPLDNAILYLNGQRIGPLPCETTLQDLTKTVPAWTPIEESKENRSAEAPRAEYADFGLPDYPDYIWGLVPLFIPQQMQKQLGLERLSAKVTVNGVAGYSQMHDVRTDNDKNHNVKLMTRFSQWELGLETLFDQARLYDYQPPAQWHVAFESYGWWGEERLRLLATDEPELAQLLYGRARYKYDIDQIDSPEQAWSALQKISEDAVTAGGYSTLTTEGRAVEILAPKLDQDQLIHEALRRIDGARSSQYFSTSYGRYMDKPWFATTEPKEFQGNSDVLRAMPIAHAVWLRNKSLLAENQDSDTVFQRALTPAMLARSITDPSFQSYAESLGGSAYDTFLLRQDWRKVSTDYGDTVGVGDFKNRANNWYFKLTQLDSPAGRKFRMENESRLLELSANAFGNFERMSGTFPDKLQFLFMDRNPADGIKSLAMKFWPTYESIVDSMKHPDHGKAEELKWEYLAKMWPESTVEMFVKAADHEMKGRQQTTLPATMPAEDQFKIYAAVQDKWKKRLATLTEPIGRDQYNYERAYHWVKWEIERIESLLQNLPCLSSAERFAAFYEADFSNEQQSNLAKWIVSDRIHDDHLEVLASHKSVAFRLAVVPAIRNHPIARRRLLLQKLKTDEDPDVRDKAIQIEADLNHLKSEEFASRPELKRE